MSRFVIDLSLWRSGVDCVSELRVREVVPVSALSELLRSAVDRLTLAVLGALVMMCCSEH